MPYIGRPLNAGNLSVDVFTGNASTTVFTLTYSVGSSNSIGVYLDGVRQLAGTDFTASGTTLTFTTAPANGVGIDVYFLGLELSIPTPADATVAKAKITTTLINEHVDTTITAADSILFSDATDSNANKKDTVQGLLDLVSAGITLGTAVASTSGTTIDFTGIPTGTKRIMFSYSALSLNGSSNSMIQLGDAGGFETSGYVGASGYSGGSMLSFNYSTGFKLGHGEGASTVFNGIMTLMLLDASTYTWCASNAGGMSDVAFHIVGGGYKSLTSELTQVRLTTVNGSTAFDAGKVNISYE